MTTPTPPRRRWLRYSLRTLFVLVTVLGVFLAWLTVQLKWIRDRHEALERVDPAWRDVAEESRSQMPWGLRMLGEPAHEAIAFPEAEHSTLEQVEAHGRRLQRLFPEAAIFVDEGGTVQAPIRPLNEYLGTRKLLQAEHAGTMPPYVKLLATPQQEEDDNLPTPPGYERPAPPPDDDDDNPPLVPEESTLRGKPYE